MSLYRACFLGAERNPCASSGESLHVFRTQLLNLNAMAQERIPILFPAWIGGVHDGALGIARESYGDEDPVSRIYGSQTRILGEIRICRVACLDDPDGHVFRPAFAHQLQDNLLRPPAAQGVSSVFRDDQLVIIPADGAAMAQLFNEIRACALACR